MIGPKVTASATLEATDPLKWPSHRSTFPTVRNAMWVPKSLDLAFFMQHTELALLHPQFGHSKPWKSPEKASSNLGRQKLQWNVECRGGESLNQPRDVFCLLPKTMASLGYYLCAPIVCIYRLDMCSAPCQNMQDVCMTDVVFVITWFPKKARAMHVFLQARTNVWIN